MTARRDSRPDWAAGPVVRPYARTRVAASSGSGEGAFPGLIDIVVASGHAPPDSARLSPDQGRVLAASEQPVTVVDLASDLELPVGVVRALLRDLSERGLLAIRPARRAPVADAGLLRDLRDGLQGL